MTAVLPEVPILEVDGRGALLHPGKRVQRPAAVAACDGPSIAASAPPDAAEGYSVVPAKGRCPATSSHSVFPRHAVSRILPVLITVCPLHHLS